ncbi:ABC transporter ATP-binding protein [Candidatus Woesearchaeota archaeon]|nr:ABC transporter ATP-binding protein [Candidatus Woesearchaeota archaeon]
MANHKKSDKIDYLYNLKLYFNFAKKYKAYFFIVLLLILIVEATSVAEKFLFKLLIDRATDLSNRTLQLEPFIKILTFVAIMFIIVSLIRVLGKWLNLHFINKLEGNLILDLKIKFFNHILHLSHNFYTSHKTGSLISRLIRGSHSIESLTDLIVFNFSPLFFQLVVSFGSIIYFDFVSALIVVFVILAFILYSVFINYFQQEASIKFNDAEDFEKANISDTFTNIESIKYFGKENFIKRRFAKIGNITKESILRFWQYTRWLESGQAFIISIGTILLIYFPMVKFLNNEIELGTLVFIYTVYLNLMAPLWGFVYGIRNFYRAMSDFHSLYAYAKIENDIKDLSNAEELKIKHGKIEFKNVNFSYKNRNILKNFNLVIPEKKKIALVGPSGAGKSTIIKLLYRLYDVDSGEILIDGKNINKFMQESLRSELSIVPQECVLFDDTIYNNILFSRPSATKTEVFEAIKFAQLDKIINKFPNKEKTIVGERGIKLSGGEKQRVSIARAILADKKVLVLDEATSSLDSETEHEIQKDLEDLMKERTSIIIAHRLSTVMKADFIVVVDNGRVVEVDTHQQLINKPGLYKKLWNLQKGGYSK